MQTRTLGKRKDSVRKEATELFNSLPDDDRRKAGLGYSLAQLDMIANIRQRNKANLQAEDRKLADWAKNIERTITKEYIESQPLKQSKGRKQ